MKFIDSNSQNKQSSSQEEKSTRNELFYHKVRDEIKGKIMEGTYKYNEKIPSERELCRIYDVSRTTIRKAVDELCANGFLVRKQGSGTYVNYKQNKKNLPAENVLFIQCVHNNSPEVSSSVLEKDIFYPEIFNGLELNISEKNYHCTVKTIDEYNPDQEHLHNLISKVKGIICCELHNKDFLNFLQDKNLPLVLVSPSVEVDDIDLVEIDNRRGAYKAVSYFLKKGLTEIAHISGPTTGNIPSRERRSGYEAAMREYKVQNRQVIAGNGWYYEDGYRAMEELLAGSKIPEAVFAASDSLALGAMNALKDSRISIPDEIQLIGFDDIELARQIRPTLSTVRVKRRIMGEVAANLLLEQISQKRDFSLKVTVPVELKNRGTTVND